MIIYRTADSSDLPQIVALLREIMECHDVAPPSAADLSTCVSAILESQDHLFMVADESGSLLGMCALLFSMSTWSAAPVCEIQDLIVTAEHRGLGVGRSLVAQATELARDRGCARVFLLAEYWNLDAHAFYRALDLDEKTCLDFERSLRSELP